MDNLHKSDTEKGDATVSNSQEKIEWHIRVPIFRNTIVLKQLGLAVGIPFGLLVTVLIITSGKSVYTLYALGLLGALLVLTWLFIMVVYGGKYDVEFVLDEKGALCRTQARQAKKNKIINTLTVFLGLLTGKPAVAGAGILAQSRQQVFIRWNRVKIAKYKPRQRTVLLQGGWAESIALFCTQENYPMVEQLVMSKTQAPHS